jgi:hypothetical protein
MNRNIVQSYQDEGYPIRIMPQITIPTAWISSRQSSPDVLRRRYGPFVAHFLKAMKPGDELRSFQSPQKAWRVRMGRRGYVLVRKGLVVNVLKTAMN